jgi:sugar lactone lactonase YvrE
VSDCGNERVQLFHHDLTFERSIFSDVRAFGLCIDPSGLLLFVTETEKHQITTYRLDGSVVRRFGSGTAQEV